MKEKIEPTQDERDWLTAHKFSCWVKDGRAWSYDGGDGLVIDLFLENMVDGKHEWLMNWHFEFGNGASLVTDDVCGFASPENAVAEVVAAVSKIDSAGKLLKAAVEALYGEENNNDKH